jgi:hypothetical protein
MTWNRWNTGGSIRNRHLLTPSVDVDILEGQDQEPVAGSGTHLGGVVVKTRTKVKYSNDSEKVTVDAL